MATAAAPGRVTAVVTAEEAALVAAVAAVAAVVAAVVVGVAAAAAAAAAQEPQVRRWLAARQQGREESASACERARPALPAASALPAG